MGMRLALAAVIALGAGCADDGEYRVVVRVPGGPSRAVRVDVWLIRSCDEVTVGDVPGSSLRSLTIVDGASTEPIGAVDQDLYGLYGRAWEDGCTLFAAGCAEVAVRAGGDGELVVALDELSPTRGCDAEEECIGGRCRPRGGDGDADADADCEPGGAQCSQHADCCSAGCVFGFCTDFGCADLGDACDLDIDCCTGRCSRAGDCIDECLPECASCALDEECCSGLCLDGECF